MAKSKKTGSGKSVVEESTPAEDLAEEIEALTGADDAVDDTPVDASEDVTDEDVTEGEALEEDASDAETEAEDGDAGDGDYDDLLDDDADPEADPEAEEAEEEAEVEPDYEGYDEDADEELDPGPAPAPPPVAPAPVRRVGFFPTLIGGLIAGVISFAAGWMLQGRNAPDLQSVIDAQAVEIAELSARIDALPTEQPDLAPLSADIEAASGEVAAAVAAFDSASAELSASLDARIAEFDSRLTAVERAPSEDGGLSATAIASLERELEAMRADVAAQQSELQAMAAEAEADLAAARAETEAAEAQAAAEAQDALRRAALAEIRGAMDDGTPFDTAIADLASLGTEAPAALADLAADGAPTLAALESSFPEAARAALSAARSEGLADQDSNAFTAFLKNQLDVRSVTPREGDDPDAVLSRAEAALAGGDLDATLAEIGALPEVVRAELSGWTADATARSDALSALAALDATLSN